MYAVVTEYGREVAEHRTVREAIGSLTGSGFRPAWSEDGRKLPHVFEGRDGRRVAVVRKEQSEMGSKMAMDREQAERRIRDLLVEIGRISKEYGTKDYLDLTISTGTGCVRFNNEYWEDDEDTPLNHHEFGIDFDRAEGGDEDGAR